METDKGKEWAEIIWPKIVAKIEAEQGRMGSKIPYAAHDGVYDDRAAQNLSWWCNGFWPGTLWLVYHSATDRPALADPAPLLETARAAEERLDGALSGFEGLHHDVGFMWTLSALLDWRLTGKTLSRTRALHAATLLAGRYNMRGHFIRAWNKQWTGWIIVDCLMNLPLLYWASRETNDPRFRFIAMDHAETALKYLLRPDGSCNHIASLDPENGALLEYPQGQGFSPESAWSRGQAWALYGFALSALHTGEARYLEGTKKAAQFFIAEMRKRNWTAPSDFRSPAEPQRLDLSAGVIAACGLLCLARLTGESQGAVYVDAALDILRATADRFCDWDTTRDGLVQQCTAQYHDKPEERHVPLIYGDYFFVEAVHSLLYPEFQVW
jgi:unsaturated chondroitin disaccharide hydrolase